MKIVIATVQTPFCRGGAEILAEQLQLALQAEDHDVHIAAIPFCPYPPERLIDHILAFRLLDLTEAAGVRSDLFIGLKFPAYLISHPHKVIWLVHQHRTAYDLWDHPLLGDLARTPGGENIRTAIHQADRAYIPQNKAVFTISRNVSKRLKTFCGIDSQPLYQPPHDEKHYTCRQAQSYFFFPSRISTVKRQQLVLESLGRTRNPVAVRFAGTPDYPPYLDELKALAKRLHIDSRVDWMGHVNESQVIGPYADCLGVIYPPVDEDYGFVTLEAMLSSKPVITCTDSGGPLEFIQHGESGLVTQPEPDAMAKALDTLWENRERAAAMGRNARAQYLEKQISWGTVTRALLA